MGDGAQVAKTPAHRIAGRSRRRTSLDRRFRVIVAPDHNQGAGPDEWDEFEEEFGYPAKITI